MLLPYARALGNDDMGRRRGVTYTANAVERQVCASLSESTPAKPAEFLKHQLNTRVGCDRSRQDRTEHLLG